MRYFYILFDHTSTKATIIIFQESGFFRTCHGYTNANEYFLNNFRWEQDRELRFSPLKRANKGVLIHAIFVFLISISNVFFIHFSDKWKNLFFTKKRNNTEVSIFHRNCEKIVLKIWPEYVIFISAISSL